MSATPAPLPADTEVRWAETLQAMESVSRGEVLSGEAVRDWLRSWGTRNELSMPEPG